jgi:hypothetical protein
MNCSMKYHVEYYLLRCHTVYSLAEIYGRFGGTYYLHFRSRKVSQQANGDIEEDIQNSEH